MGTESRPCRGCGAPIVFAKGPNGRSIPLDMKAPVYILDAEGNAVPAQHAHVTHFATCPKADEFRRKKSAGGPPA